MAVPMRRSAASSSRSVMTPHVIVTVDEGRFRHHSGELEVCKQTLPPGTVAPGGCWRHDWSSEAPEFLCERDARVAVRAGTVTPDQVDLATSQAASGRMKLTAAVSARVRRLPHGVMLPSLFRRSHETSHAASTIFDPFTLPRDLSVFVDDMTQLPPPPGEGEDGLDTVLFKADRRGCILAFCWFFLAVTTQPPSYDESEMLVSDIARFDPEVRLQVHRLWRACSVPVRNMWGMTKRTFSEFFRRLYVLVNGPCHGIDLDRAVERDWQHAKGATAGGEFISYLRFSLLLLKILDNRIHGSSADMYRELLASWNSVLLRVVDQYQPGRIVGLPPQAQQGEGADESTAAAFSNDIPSARSKDSQHNDNGNVATEQQPEVEQSGVETGPQADFDDEESQPENIYQREAATPLERSGMLDADQEAAAYDRPVLSAQDARSTTSRSGSAARREHAAAAGTDSMASLESSEQLASVKYVAEHHNVTPSHSLDMYSTASSDDAMSDASDEDGQNLEATGAPMLDTGTGNAKGKRGKRRDGTGQSTPLLSGRQPFRNRWETSFRSSRAQTAATGLATGGRQSNTGLTRARYSAPVLGGTPVLSDAADLQELLADASLENRAKTPIPTSCFRGPDGLVYPRLFSPNRRARASRLVSNQRRVDIEKAKKERKTARETLKGVRSKGRKGELLGMHGARGGQSAPELLQPQHQPLQQPQEAEATPGPTGAQPHTVLARQASEQTMYMPRDGASVASAGASQASGFSAAVSADSRIPDATRADDSLMRKTQVRRRSWHGTQRRSASGEKRKKKFSRQTTKQGSMPAYPISVAPSLGNTYYVRGLVCKHRDVVPLEGVSAASPARVRDEYEHTAHPHKEEVREAASRFHLSHVVEEERVAQRTVSPHVRMRSSSTKSLDLGLLNTVAAEESQAPSLSMPESPERRVVAKGTLSATAASDFSMAMLTLQNVREDLTPRQAYREGRWPHHPTAAHPVPNDVALAKKEPLGQPVLSPVARGQGTNPSTGDATYRVDAVPTVLLRRYKQMEESGRLPTAPIISGPQSPPGSIASARAPSEHSQGTTPSHRSHHSQQLDPSNRGTGPDDVSASATQFAPAGGAAIVAGAAPQMVSTDDGRVSPQGSVHSLARSVDTEHSVVLPVPTREDPDVDEDHQAESGVQEGKGGGGPAGREDARAAPSQRLEAATAPASGSMSGTGSVGSWSHQGPTGGVGRGPATAATGSIGRLGGDTRASSPPGGWGSEWGAGESFDLGGDLSVSLAPWSAAPVAGTSLQVQIDPSQPHYEDRTPAHSRRPIAMSRQSSSDVLLPQTAAKHRGPSFSSSSPAAARGGGSRDGKRQGSPKQEQQRQSQQKSPIRVASVSSSQGGSQDLPR